MNKNKVDKRTEGVKRKSDTTTKRLKLQLSNLVEAVKFAQDIIDTVREPLLALDSSFKVVSANTSFYKLFKVSKKDTIGTSVFKLGDHQWDIQGLRTLLADVLPKKKIFKGFETTHTFPSIGQKTMLLNARQIDHVQLILLAIEDITLEKEAQKKNKEIDERFHAVWDVSADALSVSDKNGIVIAANLAYYSLYGYSEKEVISKPFSIIFSKEFEREAIKEYKKHFNGEYNPTPVESQIVHKNGKKKMVEVRYSFIMNAEKRVAMLSVIRDITQRKRLENHKDEFMGIVSHELKTPVTSLKAFAQVLQKRFKKEGNIKSADYLAKMDAQINKLTVLIEDLLDVTKIEGGRLQFHQDFFYFDELVSEIVEEVQRTTIRHKLIEKGGTQRTICGDRERIGQVIMNLLTNAIKYSPHSEKIVIATNSDKTNVSFCVTDYGVGISPEKQTHLFDRFFRVSGTEEQTFPGLGLGLYISKEILERHGGRIWVKSEKGRGATFCFTLPINSPKKLKQQKNHLAEEEMKHE